MSLLAGTDRANAARAWLQTTGGIVGVLLLAQFLTGILLAFYYVPSVDHAHVTVSYVEKVVSSGSWLRSLHHYGSQWLALFLFLHVVQLFLSEAYVARRVQWTAAILLLALVMAAAGTGYSLPWDARAFFSVRVAEGLMGGLPFVGRYARLWLLGGNDISTITLSRFFALHVLVTPFAIAGVVVWWLVRRVCWSNLSRNSIAGGLVFVVLALWSFKFPAPLGPPVEAMAADYLPRPGAQFLWLYEILKYVPGGVGSLVGVVLPGIALTILLLLPWSRFNSRRLVGGLVLASFTVAIVTMTFAAYWSDRRDARTREQLARQAAQEAAFRREPFTPAPLTSSQHAPQQQSTGGGPPVPYARFCANCHGAQGEGGRQGRLTFPPLLNVSNKPQRTVEDIVALLKDPSAYGLEPPMRSFSGKLTEQEMREVAEWVVRLKR